MEIDIMSFKIVVDSCCELPEEYLQDPRFEIVPLGLEVEDYRIQDDENFDQAEFLKKVAESPKCPKSACPSPEKFREAYRTEAEHVYAITLSSHLSGSYNSAVLGMNLYREKYGNKQIHVIDSESASCGETQIVKKLVELVASTLSIKPIMAGDKGNIVQRGQSVGMKKALRRMAEIILEEVGETKDRTLMITHCNAPDRAETIQKLLTDKVQFKDCLIMDTRGVSSMYANDGGVIVTV